ncbi:MAG: hypothetical protein KJ060_19075 [Candidatus Hydrogenedentes bacterium]|nr:hypothetical protein [Candidatus Hydrogenedentota bacterium]
MTVRCQGHRLIPSMCVQELVGRLMDSTPNLPALRGNGCFLPSGASVGWDCEKIELRTAETHSNRGAVTEHLRLRQWVYETVDGMLRTSDPRLTLEMSCGGACYATGKTFGTHFNIDLRSPNLPMISENLRTLYVIGLPFHGAGALRFGSPEPCWSAHVECRALQSLFSYKNVQSSGRCRLQIATSAGCSRSPLSVSLGFGWLTLMVAAIEAGLQWEEIPHFEDIHAAALTFNRDFDGTGTASTTKGALSLFECIEQVLPILQQYADSDDLADIGNLLGRAIECMRTGPTALATSHDPLILHAYLHRLAARHEFDRERLQHANGAFGRLDSHRQPNSEAATDTLYLLEDDYREEGGPAMASRVFLSHAMDEDTLAKYSALKAEAEELYTRWPVLGDGLFDKLDAAGALEYSQFGFTLPDRAACVSELASPRAHVRGQFVAEHAADPGLYSCTWDSLVDKKNGLTLALTDPDKPESTWMELRTVSRAQSETSGLRRLLPAIDVYLGERTPNPTVSDRPYRAPREPMVRMQPAGGLLRGGSREPVPSSQQDPLFPLLCREILEPCFGICHVDRGRARGLIRLLRDQAFIDQQIAIRTFADVAGESARSVARLIQVNRRRFDHEHVRFAFARPLVKTAFRQFARHYGVFGYLGDCLRPVHQIIGPSRTTCFIACLVRVAGEVFEENNWRDKEEMGVAFAIQFSAETGDFQRCLAVSQWAEDSPALCGSPRIRHYRGEAMHLYAQSSNSIRERSNRLRTSLLELRIALEDSTFDGEQRGRCERALARINRDLEATDRTANYALQNERVNMALDWLRRRAELARSDDARTTFPFELGGGRIYPGAFVRAQDSCQDDEVPHESQEIDSNATHSNPCRAGYIPELEESVRQWTLIHGN